MRFIAWSCGFVLLFALSAGAQLNPANSLLLASSEPGVTAAASAPNSPTPSLPAPATASAAVPANPAESAPIGPAIAPPEYNWQVYIGYTFVRFYELPKIPSFPHGLTFNTNGLNVSGVYYLPTINWVGFEGDAVGTFGPIQCSKFALIGGGARIRVQWPNGFELWAHGTLDMAHILPQTSFGGQTSFAYQIGGGADYFTRFHNIGVRVEGDLVGTHFFSTYQRSLQISAGIVYRF
ncbi:MAG: hypothetical protein ACLQMT_10560 [Candidatus Acidiferrales bacterium]